MVGLGEKLRARAAELGLSGAEVARRAGLTATRYGHYLADYREPDLATLVRICRVLGIRPDVLLGYEPPPGDPLAAKRAAIAAYMDAMDAASLDLVVPVVQAIAATKGLRRPVEAAADAAVATVSERPRARRGAKPKEATLR